MMQRLLACGRLPLFLALAVGLAGRMSAQSVAFNDYAAGILTHSNATTFGPGKSGKLRDIATGAPLNWTVDVTATGVVDGGVQGNPTYGTPASVVFDGFVDFFGQPNPGLELPIGTEVVTYSFSGLDPNAEYNFQGTAIRGHFSYKDRWSIFEITGAVSFTSRHTAGALTTAQVPALTAAQVAINTGDNNRGDLAWWEHIQTGPDGRFAVTSKRYTGTVPGGSSAGAKGYGIIAFRLEDAGLYAGRTFLPPRVPSSELASINGLRTIFIILMENHDWSTILGSSFCPYINNTLLPRSSYATRYHSPLSVHPSLPNYLWLAAGTNFNIRNDDDPSLNHQSSTKTLFHQLDQAGISWKTYQEDITGKDVPDVNSGSYAVRHNPAVYFDSIRNNLNYCTNHVRPYPELARDLTNNTVPRFCFISPNVINDMHDTASGSPSSRKQGDDWLAREVPRILASAAYTNGGALFLTWDEGSSDGDGPIGMLVLSPRAKGGGYHNSLFYTHSSWVRTVQDIFGLRPYLADAAYARDLSDLFKTVRLTSAEWLADTISLTITNVIAGKTNVLQASASLAPANWANVQTNVAKGDTITITDTPAAPSLFYRLVEWP